MQASEHFLQGQGSKGCVYCKMMPSRMSAELSGPHDGWIVVQTDCGAVRIQPGHVRLAGRSMRQAAVHVAQKPAALLLQQSQAFSAVDATVQLWCVNS